MLSSGLELREASPRDPELARGSCPAARATVHPFSRILAGKRPSTSRTPAGSVEDPVPPGTARHIVPTQHPLAPPARAGVRFWAGVSSPHLRCGAGVGRAGVRCGAGVQGRSERLCEKSAERLMVGREINHLMNRPTFRTSWQVVRQPKADPAGEVQSGQGQRDSRIA